MDPFKNIQVGEERAGCFALFVFLVSGDCCVALPHDATGLSAVLIVVFPDHTHLLLPCPHIAQLYKIIGLTVLLNRVILKSKERSSLRIFLGRDKRALLACSAIGFLVFMYEYALDR